MNEIDKTSLSDQTKFRLNEIRKIESHFNSEINQRKLCSKKTEQICFCFWSHRQDFNCFKCSNWGVFIISHATVVGAPVGIASVLDLL